ncbi:ATP-binding protein [Streptomyces sp. NPDC057743]|uniref:ATP-binding protein n=1 Tax=Streptomyces sp. NPDC057743 TaxID=3346236 RepID=UPI0036CBA22D
MRVHSRSFFLVRDPTAVPIGRRHVKGLAEKWGLRLDESADTALSVVASELVTNAVRHGTGAMLTLTLSANLSRRRLLVEVYDGSLILPVPHRAGTEDEAGRGMALVGSLSLRHGAKRTTCGKCIWAELALPAQRIARRRLVFHPRQAARAVARRLGAARRLPMAVRAANRARHGRHGRHTSLRPASASNSEARAGQQHPSHIPNAEGALPCPTS